MKLGKRSRMAVAVSAGIVVILMIASKSCSGDLTAVQTAVVQIGEIEDAIPASGKIHPVKEVKLSPDVSGEIMDIRCSEGDYVNSGDTLILIRRDTYLSRVERARASLSALKAQHSRNKSELAKAELDYRRSTSLFEEGAISKAELEASKTSYEIAQQTVVASKYTILSGEAELKEALESLAKTTICAPTEGIVSRLGVEPGERVVGTSQMAGTEMLRIADPDRMELVVDVGENDVVRISEGDSVSIEIDAHPRHIFTGKVTQIANSAKNMDVSFEKLTNFEVRMEIDPEGEKLLPGMSASASIVTQLKRDCLTIPLGSVFTEGRQEFVWVLNRGRAVEKRAVTTGIQSLKEIEVTEGLDEGDEIVTGPLSAINQELTDGQKVKRN